MTAGPVGQRALMTYFRSAPVGLLAVVISAAAFVSVAFAGEAGSFDALRSQAWPPGFPFPDFPFPPSYEVHITPSSCTHCGASWSGPRYQVNEGFDLKTMISKVYEIDPMRVDFPDAFNDGQRSDFALLLPREETQETINHLIKDGIERQFQLTITFEARPMEVYVLTAPNGQNPSLKPSPENSDEGGGIGSAHLGFSKHSLGQWDVSITGVGVQDETMEEVCRLLEKPLDRLVIDETQLKGRYGFEVHDAHTTDEFLQKLREQIGLVLTPDRRNVTMLVVRPTSS
jgi:uncharacterized protein (TIGR03435 family)